MNIYIQKISIITGIFFPLFLYSMVNQSVVKVITDDRFFELASHYTDQIKQLAVPYAHDKEIKLNDIKGQQMSDLLEVIDQSEKYERLYGFNSDEQLPSLSAEPYKEVLRRWSNKHLKSLLSDWSTQRLQDVIVAWEMLGVVKQLPVSLGQACIKRKVRVLEEELCQQLSKIRAEKIAKKIAYKSAYNGCIIKTGGIISDGSLLATMDDFKAIKKKKKIWALKIKGNSLNELDIKKLIEYFPACRRFTFKGGTIETLKNVEYLSDKEPLVQRNKYIPFYWQIIRDMALMGEKEFGYVQDYRSSQCRMLTISKNSLSREEIKRSQALLRPSWKDIWGYGLSALIQGQCYAILMAHLFSIGGQPLGQCVYILLAPLISVGVGLWESGHDRWWRGKLYGRDKNYKK